MSENEGKTRFGLRLEPKIKRSLERLAEMRGINASALVRMLIIKERLDQMEDLKRRNCYNGELEI